MDEAELALEECASLSLLPARRGPITPSPDGSTGSVCQINAVHTKTTTIRELKHDTSTVLGWVASGQTVEVRRRNQPVAILSPPKRRLRGAKPDFAERLRSVYGPTVLPATGTEIISESRDHT